MIVYVFGNPDLDFDSQPLRLLPYLQREFPQIDFIIQDPNEEWLYQDNIIMLDTVMEINQVEVFQDLSKIKSSPRLTMHDWDAGVYLKYLQKLGKVKQVTIIGLPIEFDQVAVINQLKVIFANLS